jgi:hypothetical protein
MREGAPASGNRSRWKKRNIQRNPAECLQLTKDVKTPDMSATHVKSPCIKETAMRYNIRMI